MGPRLVVPARAADSAVGAPPFAANPSRPRYLTLRLSAMRRGPGIAELDRSLPREGYRSVPQQSRRAASGGHREGLS